MKNAPETPAREDLRQRRTRKFLSDALISLLEEQPFSAISVVDICQRAMVHRTTFYAHFDDKQGLLRYTITDLLEREFEAVTPAQAAEKRPRDYFLAVFQNVVQFMRAHRGLYRTGVAECGSVELDTMEGAVAQALQRKLADPGFLPLSPDFNPELTAHFYAGAILSLVRWWLENGAVVPDEVLLLHLEHFIPLPDGPAEKG